jgi:hypothetical protein
MCKKLGIKGTENWFSHIPKFVTEHEGITVLWNEESFWQTGQT